MASRFVWICGGGILVAVVIGSAFVGHRRPPDALSQATLGQELFFDPTLSADGKTSCASCHQPQRNYTDGRAVSRGAFGRIGTRNTPSLLTVDGDAAFFWEGRRQRLEDAVLDPFLHPVELGLPNETVLLKHLQTPSYRKAFANAFGTSRFADPTREELGAALAAFVRSLPKPSTPFDRYQMAHDKLALSQDAQQGMALFIGKANCSQCHRLEGAPVRFTDNLFHSTGTGLQNIAAQLPALSQRLSAEPIDIAQLGREIGTHADVAALGRFVVTHSPADMGMFRTPSLRYVADTAPYMHDGSVATLEDAVDQEIYWRGLSSGQQLSLTVRERVELIAFLRALSLDKDQELQPPTK